MVQDGCVKSTKGDMIPLEGKRKGGPWDTKSFLPSVNFRTRPNSVTCLEEAHYLIFWLFSNHWMNVWGWWENPPHAVIEAWNWKHFCEVSIRFQKSVCNFHESFVLLSKSMSVVFSQFSHTSWSQHSFSHSQANIHYIELCIVVHDYA